MGAKQVQNCWDFMACEKQTREQCPAYMTDSGRECWLVASNIKRRGCPKTRNEYKTCMECPWFKKMNPDFWSQQATGEGILKKIMGRFGSSP